MKASALLAAALLVFQPLFAAPPAPAIGIEQALQLAVSHLKDRGLTSAHQIISLTLEDSSITGGRQYWYARWLPSIKGDDKTTEPGLQISMDGSLARVVTGGASGAGRPDNPGRRRFGSRDMR